MKRSIECFIADNLADPSLSPDKIAAKFKISRRKLYMIFANEDYSISETIRRMRLVRCAQDFTSSGNAKIFDIALRWGFNDPSHFSRLFKQHFGMGPREYNISFNISKPRTIQN